MVSIDEELEAAKAVKGAIHTLSAKDSREILPMLRDARDAATRAMIFLGEGPLNDARDEIGATLSILIRAVENSSLTTEKIDKAKGAVENWINQLGKA